MRYDEYAERDIYSSSGKKTGEYEDISSRSRGYRAVKPQKGEKRKKRKKHTLRNFLVIFLCALLLSGGGFYLYSYKMIDKIKRTPLDSGDLGISTDVYGDVRNIALLGIDSRKDDDVGRSDAIVVVTVDKKHKKIKLTSIARDTYVAIDGHKNDKLTHAYAYGKSQLAVKTLNQNFGLEITDYVTMNFFKLARVIDYIGGITVDVDEKEMKELNGNIIPYMRGMGVECPDIVSTGVQLLNGGQAVCYARIRHTDSDVIRGNRQKEVLVAMYDKVKHMNPLKMPKVAEMIVSECATSLTTNDIMSMGLWAVAFSPEFEQLSIPNDNVPSKGKTIKGVWYYTYDLNTAKKEIHDFIFEENIYSEEAKAARESEKN